jgi:Gas vesicle synthesis protein GvpL/GvpF
MDSGPELLVFALVRRSHRPPKKPVRLVAVGALNAVCTELRNQMTPSVRDLKSHMALLEILFADGPIVPFRYGTVAPNATWLRQKLEPLAEKYSTLLDELEGLVELAVTVAADEGKVIGDVVLQQPRLRVLASRARSSGLAGQVQLGERTAIEYEARVRQEAGAILNALRGESLNMIHRPPSQGSLKASFLVNSLAVDRFRALAQHLQIESGGRFQIRVTGPLPPYSFVDSPSNQLAGQREPSWES